jgi:menaquinone-specific isochorismate synthase
MTMTTTSHTTGAVASTFAAAEHLQTTTRYFSPEDAATLDLRSFAGETGSLFVRESVGIAARGCALKIAIPNGTADVGHVREILSSICADDSVERAATGPVALGSLPFMPREPGYLIVPEVLVAKSSDGTAWYTVVHPKSKPKPPPPNLVGDLIAAPSPHEFSLRSAVSHERWCELIAEAVTRIEDGSLDKVVLARAVDVEASSAFVLADILARLEALFPSCMVFSMDITVDDAAAPVRFIGASPELLVSRKGTTVKAHPLAGTIARSGDPETDARLASELLRSTKDRWEHSLVIDTIDAILRPICSELDVPAIPSIVPLRNVSHLGTLIVGSLPAVEVSTGAAPSALEFASALHPTPAVGGVPTQRSLQVIRELEPTERGHYAGPVGWVDAAGNGEWAVGLRTATVSGACARMMAGGGIVSDSEPNSELAETQLKLQALLSAVVRP